MMSAKRVWRERNERETRFRTNFGARNAFGERETSAKRVSEPVFARETRFEARETGETRFRKMFLLLCSF